MRSPAVWLLLLAASCGVDPAPAGTQPSFLIVYCDDLRFDAASAGGNPWIATPHLDRLAQEGALVERAYVVTSRCCPARASLLTGNDSNVTGVWTNRPDIEFPGDQRTFADELRAAGWRTAWIGKWHLPNPGAGPVRGFDHWVSYEGPGRHFAQTLNVDGASVPTTGYQTDELTDRACAYLRGLAPSEPFCVVLSLKAPHVPHTPAPRHAGTLRDTDVALPASIDDPPEALPGRYRFVRESEENRHAIGERAAFVDEVKAYWELVLGIDEALGRLLAELDALGRSGDTLVLVTGDNGQMLGEHGLRQKGLSYEPSIRVPLLLRFPGRVPAGARPAACVLNVDLAPTLLDWAGLAPRAPMLGTSAAAVLADPTTPGRERFLYTAPAGGSVSEHAVVERRWKYVRIEAEGGREDVLFDLEADPDERRDLATDPAHAAELERLERWMDAELARVGVPR